MGRTPKLTWNDIDRALRSESVGKIELANSLKKQYGHLICHDPYLEASLGLGESGRKTQAKAKSNKKAAKRRELVKGSLPQYPTQVSELERKSYKEIHPTETYRKPQKLQIDSEYSHFVSETADNNSQKRHKKSKKHLGPDNIHQREIQHEIKVQRKMKTEKGKETSIMLLHDSKHQHHFGGEKHKILSEQKEDMQIESESESSASSSEQEIVQVDNSESTEESHSSEQEEDSAEEVSETEIYQNHSKQPKEDEYPHSHRETQRKENTKGKRNKSAMKYTQKEANEETNEPERCKNPSEKVQMNVNKAVAKITKQKAKKSPHMKRRSKPEKEYIAKETQYKGKTQRKNKTTKYNRENQMVCGSWNRHKVKQSEQRVQKEVQIESESESSASCSKEEIVNTDDFETAEESYSSEQEEDSAEEVSETKRYQKPSEQPREDEYPHSHRETPVRKTKGKRGKSSDLDKTKFESQSKPEGKAKQKKEAEDVSSEASQHEMAGDAHGKREKLAQEHKQKKSEKHSKRGVQEASRENESESSAMRREGKRVSPSYHRGKSRKPKSTRDMHQQKQSLEKKLDYKTKASAKMEVEKKAKENVPIVGEQSSDEEVREKTAPKSLGQKEVQTKSESEDESSSTSDDQSEPHLHESTKMKQYHKVHPNSDGNEIEKERGVNTKKKTQGTKQKGFHSSFTDMREQSKEGKTSSKFNQKREKVSKEKYLKADGMSTRKEREERPQKRRISSKKKVVEPSSEEDKESDSDDSSEDEEDRDSEQKSSNEEEETEPDDESSPDTSEEEMKRKPAVLDTKERVKETRGRKGKRVRIAADVLDLPGDGEQPYLVGRDQEEHDIQPKKRSRRRHRESSMSPKTRGSSSPSTSQDDNQKYRHESDPGRKKNKVIEKQNNISSTETDSSQESEMLRSLSKAETKNLIKVFKCFFGRLCCAIKDPVETAAQLQAKRLISRSIMENIITSPESQQIRAITLVRALDIKIKEYPDKIFIVASIFLESELLQEVGRQMWIEAGISHFMIFTYADISISIFLSECRKCNTKQS